MADRKRLLGVFIPSKKPHTLTQEPVAEAILHGPPPPFSAERRTKLDAGGPDYEAMSKDELKRRMQLKKIGLRDDIRRSIRSRHWGLQTPKT